MPRTRQGGDRGGSSGTSYPNRTDIAAQPNLPARVATNQTYGKAQSQLEAQRTIPMAPAPLPLPTGPQPSPQGPGAVPPPGPAPGPSPIPPGAFGDLHRPTERPLEPVTAGASLGPGPGTEALPTSAQMTGGGNSLSTMLAGIANRTGSEAVRALAQHAQAAGT